MKRNVSMGGNPLTLIGKQINVGDIAPSFKAVNKDMTPFTLESLENKVKIISVVPSVDTKVCELQTIQFNEEADQLKDVIVLTISVDLPFAQSRFCVANTINSSVVVSDHKDLDFGMKYGFVIEELRLLSRGIVILDKNNKVTYVEYVPEVTTHPNYDLAIEAAKKLL